MAMVKEKRYEKSEEPEEIDETHTDRNMQHEQEESKKKLVITRRQVCDMDKVRYAVKRPGSALGTPTHTLAINTNYQVKSVTMELDMAMVKEYEKPKEPKEIDETDTDRNTQHEQEQLKKKLVITRQQVCDMDNAHKNPHTTHLQEKSPQPSEAA